MSKTQRNFATGIMNKSVDERLLPNGEYSDAMNVRLGSTEASEIGSVENAKGNELVGNIAFPPTGQACSAQLSPNAVCLGSHADPSSETIYWFVHDPTWMGIYPTDSGGATPPGTTLVTSTTTGVALPGILQDATQTFLSSVSVGDIVRCGTCTNADYAYITEVSNNEIIKLSTDLTVGGFPPGTAYTITQNVQRCDMIVSYNTISQITNLLVVSMWDGVVCADQWTTTLNFNPKRLITGINLIDNMLFFTDNYNPPRKINVTRSYDYPIVTAPVAPSTTCTIGVDQFLASQILVIKAPPLSPPTISFPEDERIPSVENFLQNRFISFAYRWKYQDREYSALSPFTEVAFAPESFVLGPSSLLNEGMINKHQSVIVEYNTGSFEVIEIELVFKEADSNIIKVIEKVSKLNDAGDGIINNNLTQSLTFSNDKIYTVLPSDEILRLYDNVPRRAKAQTLMGNRIMYSNYVEGYNLVNRFNFPVTQQWQASLGKETPGLNSVPITYAESFMSTFKFGTSFPLCQQPGAGGSSFQVPNQKMTLDFTNIPLVTGAVIRLRFAYNAESNWNTGGVCWYDTTGTIAADGPADAALTGETIEFSFTIDKDYDNIEALWNDSDNALRNALGWGSPSGGNPEGNIQTPLPGPTGCVTGSTLTDRVNCLSATQIICDNTAASPQYLYRSIAADSLPCPGAINEVFANQSKGLAEYVTATGNTLELKTIPIIYTTDQNLGAAFDPSAVVWPSFQDATCVVDKNVSGKSLHSNRGYQLGIIYLDEFGRATPALTSRENTIKTSCADSPTLNYAEITIPPTQIAPKWATHFRFVIKPTKENYETIYCSQIFGNMVDGSYWFLLEGENANKVEVGDSLICKRDANGPVTSCERGEVLAKGVKEANFILSPNPAYSGSNSTDSSNDPGTGSNPQYLFVPQGVYMQLKNMTFTVPQNPVMLEYPASAYGDDDAIIIPITQTGSSPAPYNDCARLSYRGIHRRKDGDDYPELPLPEGTTVRISFRLERGANPTTGARLLYTYDKTFTADTDYDNIVDFWNGLGIGSTFNQGVVSGSVCNGITVNYLNTLYEVDADTLSEDNFLDAFDQDCQSCTYNMRWAQLNNEEILLLIEGGIGGGTQQTKSSITATFDISFSAQNVAFETEPSEALPNLWYESSVTYPIDTATGAHQSTQGTDISQVPGIPGQPGVTTGYFKLPFFNCFAFGDGIESYKSRDSLTGKSFSLGNRVTATSEDYGLKHRFADITYSGVYNDESNVNRLNEFNLGLANFKSLEDAFGHVQVLSGRETDVLVLQEDKISYVLAGKNLLSDSSGGGTVASVPEVLGTQIARVEDYGISKNAESFAEYGFDKYFTDQKRGAVLRLRGSAGQNEQLDVISEYGLRSWFRDSFNGRGEASATAPSPTNINLNTQKIGGFDPYMNEYVVSLNDNSNVILNLDPCDADSVPDFLGDSDIPDVACGDDITVNSTDTTVLTQNVVLGTDTGQVTWELVATGVNFDVSISWNSTVAASGTAVAGGGILTLTWTKDVSAGAAALAIVTITPTGSGIGTLSWTAACPAPSFLTTIPIVFTAQPSWPLNSTTSCIASEAQGNIKFQWSANIPSEGGVVSGPDNEELFYIDQGINDSIFGNNNFPICAKWNASSYVNQVQAVSAPPNGATMTVELFDYEGGSEDDQQTWEVLGITKNMFDVNKCKLLWFRSSTLYSANNADAITLRGLALAAGNVLTLESWDATTNTWVTAVNGSTRYRGTFTVPTPVAPATDPYLYIIYDINLPTEKLMCVGTSITDSCCECTCPAGTVSTCYKITHQPVQAQFNAVTPSLYSYQGTNPSTGLPNTVNLFPNNDSDQPTVVYICSSTFPVLTNAANLVTQPNGLSWPFPTITINECSTGVTCTSCP